jgi:hypothetical protein
MASKMIYTPKAALCFIINYEHELAKEALWREWIAPNADIINVYFYYADKAKIKSPWVLEHAIADTYIKPTTYMNVMPAYLGLTRAALAADEANQWLIYLTDFDVPIISPRRFRYLFMNYYDRTFMGWKPAWWDVTKERRANLQAVTERFRLANSPWFTMSRGHALAVIHFIRANASLAETVFNGIVANESFFAVALEHAGLLKEVVPVDTHLSDWSRVSSATSPHKFELSGDPRDRAFIEEGLAANPMAMFLRKVMPAFPDATLQKYMAETAADAALVVPDKWSKWRLSAKGENDLFCALLVITGVVFIWMIFYFDMRF